MYQLKLELIGDANRARLRLLSGICDDAIPGSAAAVVGRIPSCGWCAEITGQDSRWGFRRRFLRAAVSYTTSSGNGNRGVVASYWLKPARVYEVKSRQSWAKTRRFFCSVQNGRLEELTSEQVARLVTHDS